MQPVEPFKIKSKISPQLKLESLINNSLLFNSIKEGVSFKNSFFSNMMSIRENDSMGMLGFGDLNLSRRETSNRKDSYQMNKLGQNRQSFDLFSIKKKLHTIGSEKELKGELKKQISVGDFGKKNMMKDQEIIRESINHNDCFNIYHANTEKNGNAETRKVNTEKKLKMIDNMEPRKTFRNKTKNKNLNNVFEDILIESESFRKKKNISPLNVDIDLKSSSDKLKEITKNQKTSIIPKLKDKLRFSKKSKKKMKKQTQFDNKEIRREMKKFELETNGEKIVYNGKPKINDGPKRENSNSKVKPIMKKKKKILSKSFKKKGSFRNTGKLLQKEKKNEVIKMEDELEFDEKLKSELLNKRNLRESLKNIIDQDSKKRSIYLIQKNLLSRHRQRLVHGNLIPIQ
jgi:hypothetical protein